MASSDVLLAAYDFSTLSGLGVKAAVALGERTGASRVHVVYVLKLLPYWGAVTPFAVPATDARSLAQDAVDVARKRLDGESFAGGGLSLTREVRVGVPAKELAQLARSLEARAIVIASHGHGGVARAVLGSVASDVIRTASCPILIVGKDRPGRSSFKDVVAAVDLSAHSDRVLDQAFRFAAMDRGRVQGVTVFERMPLSTGLDDRVEGLVSADEVRSILRSYQVELDGRMRHLAAPGVDFVSEVLEDGPPWRAILQKLGKRVPDLLVVGTSGHGFFHRMMVGATASRLAAEAPCPVLVVPPEEARAS